MALSVEQVCSTACEYRGDQTLAITLAVLFLIYLVIDLVAAAIAIYRAGRPLQTHLRAHERLAERLAQSCMGDGPNEHRPLFGGAEFAIAVASELAPLTDSAVGGGRDVRKRERKGDVPSDAQ